MPSVVLPEPDSPTMPSVSPRRSVSVAALTAANRRLRKSPSPNAKLTPTASACSSGGASSGSGGATRLVVDAFPSGLLGELAGFVPPPGVALEHVARLLLWERYVADASPDLPRFATTWVVEELHDDQRRALEAASGKVRPLDLVDPASLPPEPLEPPCALVVHSGPDEETIELVLFARDLVRAERSATRVVLASPSRPSGLPADVAWVDAFPATGLFANAARIVAAAGFNAVRQTEPFRERRVLVPFPRRFDDQFTRAARARAARGGPR